MVLRLTQVQMGDNYPKEKVCDNMQSFISTFLMPVVDKSPINPVRKQIHDSKELNLLLALN